MTFWVKALRARLSSAVACWRRCSALRAGARRVVAPCHSAAAQTTRAGPMAASRIISIHPEAPVKPAWGVPCNGCGVCCLSEPCPVGVVLSRRTTGACVAVVWNDEIHRYECGMITQPEAWLPLPWRWTRNLMARLNRRWIAAGKGCDCDMEVEVAPTEGAGADTPSRGS